MGIFSSVLNRWHTPGGYREFFSIAMPLILSTASWSIQHFVDRVFLTWHSTEALAAALPAGIANFISKEGLEDPDFLNCVKISFR